MTCRLCSLGHAALLALITLTACVSGLWGALALWFRLPARTGLRGVVAALWGVLGAGLLIAAWWLHAPWPLIVDALIHAVLLAWWLSLRPTQARE